MTGRRDHWQPSLGELRYAGAEAAMRRMWDEFEQNLSRTWHGQLALRLSRAWVRLSSRH